MEFSKAVLDGFDSVLVWGEDRTAASLCAYAIARQAPGLLVWLDVRGPGASPDDYAPLLGKIVPRGSQYATQTASDLGPQDAATNTALWKVIRSDEPKAAVAGLFDFLMLPRMIQSIAARFATPSSPLVLLTTSADRIVHLYPEDVESTRRFHVSSKQQSVKIVTSYAGPERHDRFAFDHVFRLVKGPPQRWRPWSLIGEGGTAEPGSAGAEASPLEEIVSIRSALVEAGRVPGKVEPV